MEELKSLIVLLQFQISLDNGGEHDGVVVEEMATQFLIELNG